MKQKHPKLLCMRKHQGHYVYGFFCMTEQERDYVMNTKPYCVSIEKHNGGKLYFFDLDRDARKIR
jgi:hypothetical protein